MTTIDQGFLFVLLVIWYPIIFWLIFKEIQKLSRQSENILDNQATIILDKNSIGNILFNLSFFGSKVLITLLAIYKGELVKNCMVEILKDHLKRTTQKDYDNFLFIRVLYDSKDFEREHFIETMEVVIDDLITDLKLGRL